MATLVIHQPISRASLTPPKSPTPESGPDRPNSAPIPNKHLPFCPTGPAPGVSQQTPTPPASPPTKHSAISTSSILHPANKYSKIINTPPVYSLDAHTLVAACDELAGHLLPDPKFVFPWLHGLHPENQVQLAFFTARRRSVRRTPKCFRGITIVKAGRDLSRSRLKGTIIEDEVLDSSGGHDAKFLDTDPRDGFSVRNFQIQISKLATVSDIVVYGDDEAREGIVQDLAKRFSFAQNTWRVVNSNGDRDAPTFNTFVLSSRFKEIEAQCPDLVAIDPQGRATGKIMDFFQWERQEMFNMSKASEIAANVWLGPTPDSMLYTPSDDDPVFDILIDTSDLAQPPQPDILDRIEKSSYSTPQRLEFPSSGSMMPQAQLETTSEPLRIMCEWIHKLANPKISSDRSKGEGNHLDGDFPMKSVSSRPRKILIHCTDGYTESSLLALAYYMYVECAPAHEAWLRLHCEKKRNFFAYPSDVVLLGSLQPSLLPKSSMSLRSSLVEREEPGWFSRLDGSLPSRILPYMYLGNLGHANNPELLEELGIRRILSVGEPANWTKQQVESWGAKNLLFVDGVQDNGADPLMNDFERCLDFIGRGKADGSATLVHCRVGVSRSATICIAEVMASLGLSFPRAYCYVRARRLNVIIQPHLRFAYELLKWDEICQQRRDEPVKREVEWATVAREIAAMNKPYSAR